MLHYLYVLVAFGAIFSSLHVICNVLALVYTMHPAQNHDVLTLVTQQTRLADKLARTRPVFSAKRSAHIGAHLVQRLIPHGRNLLVVTNHHKVAISHGSRTAHTSLPSCEFIHTGCNLAQKHATDHTPLVQQQQTGPSQACLQLPKTLRNAVHATKSAHRHTKDTVRRRRAKLHLERSTAGRSRQRATMLHVVATSPHLYRTPSTTLHNRTDCPRLPCSRTASANQTQSIIARTPAAAPLQIFQFLSLIIHNVVQKLLHNIQILSVRGICIIVANTGAMPSRLHGLPLVSSCRRYNVHPIVPCRIHYSCDLTTDRHPCPCSCSAYNGIHCSIRGPGGADLANCTQGTPLATIAIPSDPRPVTKRRNGILKPVPSLHVCLFLFLLRSKDGHLRIVVRICTLWFIFACIHFTIQHFLIKLPGLLSQALPLLHAYHGFSHNLQQLRVRPDALPRAQLVGPPLRFLHGHTTLAGPPDPRISSPFLVAVQNRISQTLSEKRIPPLELLTNILRHPMAENGIDKHLHQSTSPIIIKLAQQVLHTEISTRLKRTTRPQERRSEVRGTKTDRFISRQRSLFVLI